MKIQFLQKYSSPLKIKHLVHLYFIRQKEHPGNISLSFVFSFVQLEHTVFLHETQFIESFFEGFLHKEHLLAHLMHNIAPVSFSLYPNL